MLAGFRQNDQLRAVLFDMDGVLTNTASLHSLAWKEMFDDFLVRYGAANGESYEPFDVATDYKRYIDGKLRYDGVAAFLAARGIELPRGDPDDSPEEGTVCGLGNRKNAVFHRLLEAEGVDVFDTSIEYTRRIRAIGIRTAVVSASKNCGAILQSAGIAELFDARVDGIVAAKMGLSGKPHPDTFLEAARRLDVAPHNAIVVEDAIAGVQAGAAGGFGLVVGVDRTGDRSALAANGADIVVSDLGELLEDDGDV